MGFRVVLVHTYSLGFIPNLVVLFMCSGLFKYFAGLVWGCVLCSILVLFVCLVSSSGFSWLGAFLILFRCVFVVVLCVL